VRESKVAVDDPTPKAVARAPFERCKSRLNDTRRIQDEIIMYVLIVRNTVVVLTATSL
jgi:hypothetical protein